MNPTNAEVQRLDSKRASQLRDALFFAAVEVHNLKCSPAVPFSACQQADCAHWKQMLTHGYIEARQGLEDEIAARDAEVREVLEALRNVNGCWCAVNIGHSESCIRTQALYTKLQPKDSTPTDS